jgi:O-6-methylguanine DNA methyltransferase
MVKIRRSRSITFAKQTGGSSRPLPPASRQSSLIFPTPWGWMGLAESKRGLAAIVLPQRSKAAVAAGLGLQDAPRRRPSSVTLREARKQLVEYLAGRRTTFDLVLDFSRGTAFQRRVWKALQAIPYGQLWSYRGLAARVGGVHYARAVGGAVGANPLPIVLPCHRVVAQDATIGGFSCGLPAKRRLLALEGSLSRLGRSDRDQ